MPGGILSHSRYRNYQKMPFHHCLQNDYSCFSHAALGLRQRYALWTARDAAAETADDSKLRGTADYWNPQTRSHNTSFIQFTLVACSSANRIQTSFTCVSRCASSLPSVSVIANDSIHTHPNTETADQHILTIPRYHLERYGRRAFSVAGPTLWNALPPAVRQANSVAVFKSLLKTHLFREAFRTLC